MLGSAEAGKATQEDSLSDKLVRDLLSGDMMHPEDVYKDLFLHSQVRICPDLSRSNFYFSALYR